MSRPTLTFRGQPDWSRLRVLRWIVPIAVVLLALTSAFYTVPPDSVAVVLRFGAYSSTQNPGLHFKLPFGIDEVRVVAVQRQLKLEFGFASEDATNPDQVPSEPLREKSMVTGDLNAVLVDWVVQYRIDDPKLYLFHVHDPGSTLRDLSEAMMREVVGDRTVDEVITVGRQDIETTALARMREVTKLYEIGVVIDQVQLKNVNPPREVQSSFNEVNKAQQDRENAINLANGEYNKAVPRAKGEAAQKVSEAEGYRLKRTNEALGDAGAFNAVLAEFVKAPNVTRTRLYLETMKEVLPALADTWIVDDSITQLLPMVRNAGKEVSK
jgi:membrane protease subunit HflK